MIRVFLCSLAILAVAVGPVAVPSYAQNAEQKGAEPGKGEAAKDAARRGDEVGEASRVMIGAAGRPECIWLGERAVRLMRDDDLDTAFRHLELYDRFGCPGEHIQISFRCVLRQGRIDEKDQKDQKAIDAYKQRPHDCWINPALPPSPASASASAAAAAAEKSGTK
jgi:hypothetical protein